MKFRIVTHLHHLLTFLVRFYFIFTRIVNSYSLQSNNNRMTLDLCFIIENKPHVPFGCFSGDGVPVLVNIEHWTYDTRLACTVEKLFHLSIFTVSSCSDCNHNSRRWPSFIDLRKLALEFNDCCYYINNFLSPLNTETGYICSIPISLLDDKIFSLMCYATGHRLFVVTAIKPLCTVLCAVTSMKSNCAKTKEKKIIFDVQIK